MFTSGTSDGIFNMYYSDEILGMVTDINKTNAKRYAITIETQAKKETYNVTKEFLENSISGQSIKKHVYITFMRQNWGDNPIRITRLYDVSSNPDTWQLTGTDAGDTTTLGLFNGGQLLNRNERAFQIQMNSMWLTTHTSDLLVYELDSDGGERLTKRSLGDIPLGANVWYVKHNYKQPYQVRLIIYKR